MKKKLNKLTLKKKLLFTTLPVLALVLLGFVAAEIGLRIKFQKIERITGVADWEVASFRGLTYFWDTYHPAYGWTNLPGYRSDARVPFRVTINSQGLRGERDYPPHPPAGVNRIAALGDSCTFGEEVDDDKTLPHFLERSLADTEVLNFGVHGFGLGEMSLRLQEVFAYHPDLVLLIVTLPSDFGRTIQTNFVHAKPAFTLENGKLTIQNTPVPLAANLPWLFRRCFTAAWLFGRPNILAAPNSAEQENALAVSWALLQRIKKQCDEHKTPLVVVCIAGPDWTKSPPNSDAYLITNDCCRLVNSMDMVVSDQVDFLRKMQRDERGVESPTGIHWSGRGNCLLAGSLARDLASKLPGWRLSDKNADCPTDTDTGPMAPQR